MEINREPVLAVFLSEAEERLQDMEQSLLMLESNTEDIEALHRVFRTAHTLKGNASAMEFDSLAAFAHVLEDLLQALKKHLLPVTSESISLLLRSVDALRHEVPAAANGAPSISAEHAALQQEIMSYAAKRCGTSTESTPAVSAAVAEGAEEKRTLRIDVSKLDQMLDLSGEISIVQGRMKRLLAELQVNAGLEPMEVHLEGERMLKQLQELVMNARLVPIGPLFDQLLRPVRDLSRGLGKLVRLETSGSDVEIDTRVYELLKDPLLHMVRNAIDHGVESPDLRQSLGKNRSASLTLSAAHCAGTIVIRLTDDGAGFEREKILIAARSAGLVTDGEKLSDSEVFALCLHAGLTTSSQVTELSGRGVGMDVVRRNIDLLRGRIEIESTPGEGSAITIRLPLTLSIIESFAVEASGETYIIPLDMIGECVELPLGALRNDSGGILDLRGEALPYIRLRDAMGLSGLPPERESVVVLHSDHGRAGLAVDVLLGEGQAIIKPLNRLFQDVNSISGSTILGDGRVAFILDVNALIQSATQHAQDYHQQHV
jgi:two-component system chemotaxis sensor kinase CheA